ncbi:MAG: DUF1207 domain-containing protein [Planctomycetia bacterium]|nr:DUF1207 domain-containing protein [Planctomycetia bacterium]
MEKEGLGFPWEGETQLFASEVPPQEEKYLCMDVETTPTEICFSSPRLVRGQNSPYSSQESQFACWDTSLKGFLPGLGRALPVDSSETWTWQWLPRGVLYRAYFASNKESRLGIHFVHESEEKKEYWDPILGGRIPLVRFGNTSALYPEGFQLDIEGAALARLTLDHERELWGTDYRFGAPLTFRKGAWEAKFGYYHISSHLGDEKLVRDYQNTGIVYRRNYVRDALMLGIAFRPDANWRFYFGFDYAFYTDDGAEPWQFELGAEYSPILLPSLQGSPFLAVHLRWSEENNYHIYTAFEVGWQWKTLYQQTCRTGLYLMSGPADQYQYYNSHENQIGYGFWYDF